MRHIRHWMVVVLLLTLSQLTVAEERFKYNIGDEVYNYLGRNFDGEKIYVEDNRGKLVIISFWASWCKPCMKELPILEIIQKRVGTDRVHVVAINQESRKYFKQLKKVWADVEMTVTNDSRGSLGRKFGVSAIPHMIMLGPDGRVVYQARGYGDESLDKIIDVVNAQLDEVESYASETQL